MMDDLDSTHFDADTHGFSLIDGHASDDDFLFSSSSEANAVDNQVDVFSEEAHADKPSDLLAVPRPKRAGKCNLRKSLAWDSAFFTSAGVLDAEELSSIMEGAETGLNQNLKLPGIQEELSKSTDSITTFESDSLTLESLEADLFCDIRASIQRSSKTTNSAKNNGERESAKKIVQPSSANMVKPKLASRKLIPAVQGSTRTLKPTSISKQVTKPVVRGKELSSTLPGSTAATGKASLEGTAVSKKMSIGASRAKSEIKNAENVKGAGKEALMSHGPHRVDSRNTLQKALASSKLSSASPVSNRTAIRVSHSSYDSSSRSTTTTKSQNDFGSATSSSSSENVKKSQSDARRKIDTHANLPPGSKIRTPSRLPMKSQSRPGESKLSAYVKSTATQSPSISPASSISEWSIESSSSTATVNQKINGLKHGSTPEEVIEDNNVSQNMQKHSIDRSLDRHDYHVASVVSQSAKQPSTGAAVSLARPGSAKPSGLRLPSPKIGFFDGAKNGSKTPSGTARSRSALPSNLPRSSAGNPSPSGSGNKAKSGSVAVKVSTLTAKTSKLDPHKSRASPKLSKQLQDHSVDLPSGNGSGTLSEVAKDVGNSGLGANKYSSALQKDSISMIVNDGSNNSIELPIPTSEISSKVSEETDIERHFTEVSPIDKDNLEVLLKTSTVPNIDDDSQTNSEPLGCFSAEIGRESKVAAVKDKEEHPDDCGPAFIDDSVVTEKETSKERSSTVTEALDGVKDVTNSGLDVENYSIGLQKDPVSSIVNDVSNSSTELPISTSAISADEGKRVAEVSLIAKDDSEGVLQTSSVVTCDDDFETNSESLRCFSPKIGRENQVAEVVDDDFTVSKEASEQSKLQCSINQQIDVVDGGANNMSSPPLADIEVSQGTRSPFAVESFVSDVVEASNSSTVSASEDPVSSIVNDVSNSSTELPISSSAISADEGKRVAEVSLIAKDDSEGVLKTSSVVTCDDDFETNSEPLRCFSRKIERDNQVAVVVDDDFTVSKEASEQSKLQCSIDHQLDVADGGPNDMSSPPLADIEVSQGTRSSFAVKSFVSDVVEASNSWTVSASEAIVKMDESFVSVVVEGSNSWTVSASEAIVETDESFVSDVVEASSNSSTVSGSEAIVKTDESFVSDVVKASNTWTVSASEAIVKTDESFVSDVFEASSNSLTVSASEAIVKTDDSFVSDVVEATSNSLTVSASEAIVKTDERQSFVSDVVEASSNSLTVSASEAIVKMDGSFISDVVEASNGSTVSASEAIVEMDEMPSLENGRKESS